MTRQETKNYIANLLNVKMECGDMYFRLINFCMIITDDMDDDLYYIYTQSKVDCINIFNILSTSNKLVILNTSTANDCSYHYYISFINIDDLKFISI